ncbi:MAG: hypothetical protein R3F62_09475 [Planctomycetota bacterium]
MPAPPPPPPPPPPLRPRRRPPPVFMPADPQGFVLWDAREHVATPEQAAPIVMEETVIIS